MPTKPTSVVHCADEVLLKEPDVKFGHRNQTIWSTETNDTRCIGDDRTFDKIVAQGHSKEANEVNREKKLQDYLAKPQRGTVRGQGAQNAMGNVAKDSFINR